MLGQILELLGMLAVSILRVNFHHQSDSFQLSQLLLIPSSPVAFILLSLPRSQLLPPYVHRLETIVPKMKPQSGIPSGYLPAIQGNVTMVESYARPNLSVPH
jgi:hypothetical protein